jgi:photosystem II stability/assembly factor-like uncharacterized protein
MDFGRLLCVLGLAAFALASTDAQAAPPVAARPHSEQPAIPVTSVVDPALFKGLKYRLVGPSRGGRVTTVTGVPSQPRTFYMGVASGGLFRTTDGGVSWVPIADGKIPLGSMGAIAVADSDPNVVYVGTGSDGLRSNVSTGRGVYRTADGGETWRFAGLHDAGQIGAVRVHPTNPNVVWVAAIGDAFKRNPQRGVFKTSDGGTTWRQVLFVNDGVGAMDVEVQPGNPKVVYAWLSRLERKPWTIISGSRDGGFYRSTDGGETFAKVTAGLPSALVGKASLAVTNAKPDRIYALIEALPGGGFYRSDDAGRTWAIVNSQPALLERPFYYTTLGADPTDADVVYAGAERFFKSIDAGRTFVAMPTPHDDSHDIWISPRNGNTMIQANDGGANVSFDGGRTWSSQMNQPTAEVYGVWVDNQFPYNLYGAQQDNTTIIITSQADPYTLEDWRSGPGCETGPLMPHPANPDVVYASCKGRYSVTNMKTGQSRNYWIGAQSLYGNPARDLIYRMQRVSPMTTSPHDPEILYYGSQYLHRTRDKGVTWEKISPDLTAFPDCCQGASGEPITRDVTGEEFYSTLYAITESPLEQGVIWTGANDGPFHVTRDNGKTWTNVTPKDLEPGGRVQWIEASPHRKGSAYFSVYRYLLGDYRPYIYTTDDYGKTWKRLTDGTNGIPPDAPTRVVREDPDREGLLYAGTEFGMFISFDNGAHWQSFQLNLPNVPVTDVKVHHEDLVVTTQGRGFWILDNVCPLHQITPQMTPSEIRLFRPRDGYRTEVSALGPMIDYHLPAAVSGPVTIDIMDAAGVIVNRYSSTEQSAKPRFRRRSRVAAPDQDDSEAAVAFGHRGRGAVTVDRVTNSEGLNRFVWDGRHSSGLAAPPARYQARLVVGATKVTQPFSLLIDPNVAADGTTVADLREQFDHNLRTSQLVADVSRVVARVRGAQMRLRAASGWDADKAKQIEAIAARLLTEPVRYGKPGLQEHAVYLAGMTMHTDQKVGRDALERYVDLKKQLDAIRAELDRLLGPETSR